jgi:hypothetical protein
MVLKWNKITNFHSNKTIQFLPRTSQSCVKSLYVARPFWSGTQIDPSGFIWCEHSAQDQAKTFWIAMTIKIEIILIAPILGRLLTECKNCAVSRFYKIQIVENISQIKRIKTFFQNFIVASEQTISQRGQCKRGLGLQRPISRSRSSIFFWFFCKMLCIYLISRQKYQFSTLKESLNGRNHLKRSLT